MLDPKPQPIKRAILISDLFPQESQRLHQPLPELKVALRIQRPALQFYQQMILGDYAIL